MKQNKKNKKEEKDVLTDIHSKWLENDIDIYEDQDLYEIVKFFVLHSPCNGDSYRANCLTKYGWKEKPWYVPSYLKDKIDDLIFGTNERIFYVAKNSDEFYDIVLTNKKYFGNDFYLEHKTQRILVRKHYALDCSNAYMSLFHHIRNCLAHYRIAMYPTKSQDVMYVMEDGDIKEDKFRVNARIVILKSSLLKIINRLKTKPEEEPNYEEDVYLAILNGKNVKSMIMKELCILEYTYKKTTDILVHKQVIFFDNKERCWKIRKKKN